MKRYTVEPALNKGQLEYIEILEDKKGEYVLYEDAKKLEDRVKELEEILSDIDIAVRENDWPNALLACLASRKAIDNA